jgi:hypothetical protein
VKKVITVKRVIFSIRVALILILLIAALYYVVFPAVNSKIHISHGTYFTESAFLTSLTSEEKENIREVLESQVCENGDYWGFKSYYQGTDLYFVHSLIELSRTLDDKETLDLIKKKMTGLNQVDLDAMSILNIIYYVNICTYLDLEYDKNKVMQALEKYYDNHDKLFFMNHESDGINSKLIMTAFCYKSVPDVLTSGQFDLVDGVRKAYDNYVFSQKDTITLYNSGGAVLYCSSVFGLINEEILTRHRDWFEYWKSKYESEIIVDMDAALHYSEYYNIAVIFDTSHSNEKLRRFYEKLTPEDLSATPDYYYINNAIRHVMVYDNSSFNIHVANELRNIVNNEPLIQGDIDLLATAYGILLSKYAEFDYNKEKLQNYINQSYENIREMDKNNNVNEMINTLYYTLILDQAANDFYISCDFKYIQKLIDKTIKSLKFKENINNEIHMARKALEIVLALQGYTPYSHEYRDELGITSGQKNKLRKGVEAAINNEVVMNSVLITDVLIIDKCLEFDLLDNDTFLRVYNSLTVDGGTRLYTSEEYQYPTEIFATSRFNACFSMMDNYGQMFEQKAFVSTFLIDDGLYALSSNNKSQMDLSSILYGNKINQYEEE